MAVGKPRRRDWLSWLSRQRDWQGQGVPERLRLMLVRDQLAALERQPAPAVVSAAVAEMARRRDLLLPLKGLGPAFSSQLTNEPFYKDFRNRSEVGGYFGLGGSPWQSGDADHEQGISKAGNHRARHTAPSS